MDNENKNLEVKKEEAITADGSERTRETRVYVPRTDIYENDKAVVVVADVPGADDSSIEIMLENDRLTINAFVKPQRPEDYSLAYAEYGIGDFQRSFTLSHEIDRDSINAIIKDGVLRLTMAKRDAPKSQKIAVSPA